MTVTDFVRGLLRRYGKQEKIPGYNHILRICKGETYPGPNLLPILCEFLDIDKDEARRMVMSDKAIHSGVAQAFTKRDKQLLKFEILWETLSQTSRDELLMLAEMKANFEGLK